VVFRVFVSGLINVPVHQVLGQNAIPVGATEAGIAVGGDDRERVALAAHGGDVECSSAQVVYQQVLPLEGCLRIVEEGGGDRFGDEIEAIEVGDFAGVAVRLPLLGP